MIESGWTTPFDAADRFNTKVSHINNKKIQPPKTAREPPKPREPQVWTGIRIISQMYTVSTKNHFTLIIDPLLPALCSLSLQPVVPLSFLPVNSTFPFPRDHQTFWGKCVVPNTLLD